MKAYANRAEQATDGLEVVADDGIVRVRDGVDTWLCYQAEYDAAIAALAQLAPIEDDEGGGCAKAEAYHDLCWRPRTVASIVGECHGAWQPIVRRAIDAGLIVDGKAYGVAEAS